jgi:protein O-GlcNAc transferase
LWARVLRAIPEARLLMAPVPAGFARTRYRQAFAMHRVDESRIEFEGRLPAEQYQGLRRRVDIALDPFPMNGGSTTCETLWMGVPLITLTGERFSARAGTSLLTTVGLAQCIARSEDEYVEIAARMAGNLADLSKLRATMRERMRRSPLMDGARFARNLEAIYLQLWRERCAAPDALQC